jgi:hypothetical protein
LKYVRSITAPTLNEAKGTAQREKRTLSICYRHVCYPYALEAVLNLHKCYQETFGFDDHPVKAAASLLVLCAGGEP